ncbi:DUF6093 family protein [Nocardioides jensenii]|uniref:DUF6093 family protein n=1 Tax=Nocardioides jensenii TaxID=1843 RepID=UPI0008307FDB|nr:DUF6093 family protein [Nocardioides jensenii]
MLRHHGGSGRRTVIPTDWSAHHRPIVTDTHGATVSLRRPGGVRGAFDEATGKWATVANEPYYEGYARIQVLPANAQEKTAAEQEISTLGYAIMLDHAVTGMQLDDLVAVAAVDDNGDPWLLTRELTITSIEGGSLHWERRLLCTDNLETPAEVTP